MSWVKRLADPEAVAFTPPGLARVFIACARCQRVMPHYLAYPAADTTGRHRCVCGHGTYRTIRLPEWKAAWWVLSRYVWRRLIWRKQDFDPRMPIRVRAGKLA